MRIQYISRLGPSSFQILLITSSAILEKTGNDVITSLFKTGFQIFFFGSIADGQPEISNVAYYGYNVCNENVIAVQSLKTSKFFSVYFYFLSTRLQAKRLNGSQPNFLRGLGTPRNRVSPLCSFFFMPLLKGPEVT